MTLIIITHDEGTLYLWDKGKAVMHYIALAALGLNPHTKTMLTDITTN